MANLIALHVLAAVIWVGGLFFVIAILRPAASAMPLSDRLSLMSVALGRFFLWVWIAIITLLITGYVMIGLLGGMGAVADYVHWMHGLGWMMFLLFGHMFFAPWRRVRTALAAGTLADASRAMNQLWLLATVNLALGLAVVVIASAGPWG